MAIAIYSIYLRATFDKGFFSCYIFEGLFLIYLLALFLYVIFNVHWFIVIVELYLEIKAEEPEPVVEEIEVKVDKEEELQLLESPKAEVDTTDKPEGEGEEKPAEEEKKEEAAKPSRRIRCPELPKCPKCPSFKPKCPSIGNCVTPDNFQ